MRDSPSPLAPAVRLVIVVGSAAVLLRHASYWSAAWLGEVTASANGVRIGVLTIDLLGLVLMLAGAIAWSRWPLRVGGVLSLAAVGVLALLNAFDVRGQPLRATWQVFAQVQLAAVPLLAILASAARPRRTATAPPP